MAAKEMLEKQVPKSRFFKNARSKAENIINNPEKLQELLNEADQKAKIKGKGLVGEAREFLAAAFRLLRAYATGQYRQTPWKSLMAVTAAVVYFVMPLDVIPDFILGLGFLDDAALIMWTLKSIRTDMDRFASWENGKKQTTDNVKIYRPDARASSSSMNGEA
jgi:uncharacterized membrane protein YkvA (DUF1232 family)